MTAFFLIVLTFIQLAQGQVEQPPICWIKSYNYSGPYHSDSYGLPEKKGIQSCHDRKGIDAERLGELHKNNREAIATQISTMLNDPSCKDVHEVLNRYQAKLKKQKEKIIHGFKVVTAHFETIKHLIDIQRQYAYGAAYNSTCSGERNGESSFIDLDTINKILVPAVAKETKVTKSDEVINDCTDVKASGNEHLKGFTVSMKKAKGKDFQFIFDPYGIPDQVILKDEKGSTIHDSGCKGASGEKDLTVKVDLAKLTGDKKVVVSIINNCEDPAKQTGVSAWELNIKCVQEEAELCVKPKNDLADLLKLEVDYYKRFLDVNAMEKHCFEHFDEDILKEMEHVGLFIHEGGVMTNGLCETMDEECLERQAENEEKDRVASQVVATPPARVPTAVVEAEKAHCPPKPKMSESIFKVITWNYCHIANKKLGLE